MRNVEIIKQVKLTLSVEQWELFNMKGVSSVVNKINTGIEKAINSNTNKETAYGVAIKVLELYSDFGASDTEPRNKLEHILEAVYN